MWFPLSFSDITIWLAITALIMLATSELISSYFGKLDLIIDKRRLRLATLLVSITFIITITITFLLQIDLITW